MPGRNNNKLTKVQSKLRYQTELAGGAIGSDVYIDVAQGLTTVNRKLFSSEHQYTIKNITAVYPPSALYDRVIVQCITAGDTWSVHNAWTKAKALHAEMQNLVLDDMPSIEGKWAEFKVLLDDAHVLSPYKLTPIDVDAAAYQLGEWSYSTFVMPQHDVDPATGEPLAAEQFTGHLVGPDSVPGASKGLVLAYAESRATVQGNAPAVLPGVQDSFYNLLSDSGSQEPELAAVIIDENDQPPYSRLEYVGAALNAPSGQLVSNKQMNVYESNLNTGMFAAQCGLIRVRIHAYLGGDPVAVPNIRLLIDVKKGQYKGVDAIPMGQ
uniref:Uncharacterized protein n=1 Tax=uncultured marine virus TaxID=186617 RepID=A0A1J0KK75_9VIRU|nr:hypothetical protein [uncultured marine virus]